MPWKPDYVTTTELGAYIMGTGADMEDEAQLALAASAASRAVDRHCHRQFGLVDPAQERRYTAHWNRRRCCWVVSVDDLQDLAGLTVTIDGNALTYTLEPMNAADEGKPYERLVVDDLSASVAKPTGLDGEVVATAKWGWSAVPAAVQQATLMQASRFHWRRNAPGGVAGSPDSGSEVRLLARVDPDLAPALSDFVRDRVKVLA